MSDDPVLRRRAQMERLAATGRGVGWGCVAVAVVAFVIGLATSFDPWGTVVVVALVASTLTLAPAIVLGYAVKAAAREDRERERGLGSPSANRNRSTPPEGEPPA